MSSVEAMQYRSPLVVECPECCEEYATTRYDDESCIGETVTCPYCGEKSTIWAFNANTDDYFTVGAMEYEEES